MLAANNFLAHVRHGHALRSEFLFRVSYLEIYNEQINDLLCPASTQANVRIMESKKLGVQLQGVKEEVVISPQQVFALISAGEAQRHVGSTDANKVRFAARVACDFFVGVCLDG